MMRDVSMTLSDADISFTVHEIGNATDDNEDGTCPNVGEIFNPLAEYIWFGSTLHPFADPSRGAISPETINFEEIEDDLTWMFTQPNFLQNLGGKNSLIGRSVKAKITNF